jgi:hypothetical protein
MSPSSELGLPPPSFPLSSVPPPEPKGGGHTRLRVKGWGIPNSDCLEKKLSILPTLWKGRTHANSCKNRCLFFWLKVNRYTVQLTNPILLMYNVCPHSLIKIYLCMMECVGDISYNRRTNICVHSSPRLFRYYFKGTYQRDGFFHMLISRIHVDGQCENRLPAVNNLLESKKFLRWDPCLFSKIIVPNLFILPYCLSKYKLTFFKIHTLQ